MMRTSRWVTLVGCVVVLGFGAMFHLWLLKKLLIHHRSPVVENVQASARDIIPFDFNGAPGPDGVPDPWQSQVIVGSMNVEAEDGGAPCGGKVLHFKCDQSHYVVYDGAKTFDTKEHPIVTWSWKGITLPTNGDVRTHGEFRFSSANRNDAGLQVLIGFEGDNVLCYLWDSSAPIGFECDEWSPVATIKTRVVESGPAHLNQWQDQSVNVYEDYQRRFGKPPGKVVGVSVQTNSNHTSSTSEGMVSTIRFQSP
jgi:hypothetical protein